MDARRDYLAAPTNPTCLRRARDRTRCRDSIMVLEYIERHRAMEWSAAAAVLGAKQVFLPSSPRPRARRVFIPDPSSRDRRRRFSEFGFACLA